MSEYTNNPVYKITTDKLQLVSINVLIRSLLNACVSQGSVVTRLRCDEICNDFFVAQLLLSPRWKNFENRSTLAKLWARIKFPINNNNNNNNNKLVRPRWPYDMRPSVPAEKYMCVIVIR